MTKLDTDTFKTIVENTPLISIDLIVKNSQGKILLGKRLNKPAKNYWFVPGGRVLKDEMIENAFSRLTTQELSVDYSIDDTKFLGVYEHFYTDNFSGDDFNTHYIVLGYEILLDIDLSSLPQEQHNQYDWFSIPDLLSADNVHQNSKNYFQRVVKRIDDNCTAFQDCSIVMSKDNY